MLVYHLEIKGSSPSAPIIIFCWISNPCSCFMLLSPWFILQYVVGIFPGIFPAKWPQQKWEEFQVLSSPINQTLKNPCQTHDKFPCWGPAKKNCSISWGCNSSVSDTAVVADHLYKNVVWILLWWPEALCIVYSHHLLHHGSPRHKSFTKGGHPSIDLPGAKWEYNQCH